MESEKNHDRISCKKICKRLSEHQLLITENQKVRKYSRREPDYFWQLYPDSCYSAERMALASVRSSVVVIFILNLSPSV